MKKVLPSKRYIYLRKNTHHVLLRWFGRRGVRDCHQGRFSYEFFYQLLLKEVLNVKKVLLSKWYICLRYKQRVLLRRVRDCHQSRFLTNLLPLTTSWQHLEMTIPRKVVLICKVVLFLSCSIVLTMMRFRNWRTILVTYSLRISPNEDLVLSSYLTTYIAL